MTEDDYFIAGIDDSGCLAVFSRMLSYSKIWPDTIIYNEKVYVYDGLSPLPNEYLGSYFSLALYK